MQLVDGGTPRQKLGPKVSLGPPRQPAQGWGRRWNVGRSARWPECVTEIPGTALGRRAISIPCSSAFYCPLSVLISFVKAALFYTNS